MRKGIHIEHEMLMFIHGWVYYEYSHSEHVKQMGLRILKSVPKYSDFLDLPADKFHPQVTRDEIKFMRVDMAFLREYWKHMGPYDVIKIEWLRAMNYPYELVEMEKQMRHYLNDIYKKIIANAEGSYLNKILDSSLRPYLIKHPLYA